MPALEKEMKSSGVMSAFTAPAMASSRALAAPKKQTWVGTPRSMATLATFAAQGSAKQHGAWVAWHENGQKMEQGTYDFGVRVGKFVSWHANGQKASEGVYLRGKQHGRWIWWHANGQQQTDGHYTNARRTGDWAWWNEAGRIEEKTSLITPRQQDDAEEDSERTSSLGSNDR